MRDTGYDKIYCQNKNNLKMLTHNVNLQKK